MTKDDIESKITSYLVNNMDRLQAIHEKNSHIPDFLFYDYFVKDVERFTGLNYIDILECIDEPTLASLLLIGDCSVEN